MDNYFYCYSYRLMYFVKSQGINYIKYGFNKNNGLKYFVFERNSELGHVLSLWNEQKRKIKEETT